MIPYPYLLWCIYMNFLWCPMCTSNIILIRIFCNAPCAPTIDYAHFCPFLSLSNVAYVWLVFVVTHCGVILSTAWTVNNLGWGVLNQLFCSIIFQIPFNKILVVNWHHICIWYVTTAQLMWQLSDIKVIQRADGRFCIVKVAEDDITVKLAIF